MSLEEALSREALLLTQAYARLFNHREDTIAVGTPPRAYIHHNQTRSLSNQNWLQLSSYQRLRKRLASYYLVVQNRLNRVTVANHLLNSATATSIFHSSVGKSKTGPRQRLTDANVEHTPKSTAGCKHVPLLIRGHSIKKHVRKCLRLYSHNRH